MAEYLAGVYRKFRTDYPKVDAAYEALAGVLHAAGPLTQRERRLVKLSVAVGANSEGAVRSHVRKAVSEGLSADDLHHAIVLSLTTGGFPHMIAALQWADEVIEAPKAQS